MSVFGPAEELRVLSTPPWVRFHCPYEERIAAKRQINTFAIRTPDELASEDTVKCPSNEPDEDDGNQIIEPDDRVGPGPHNIPSDTIVPVGHPPLRVGRTAHPTSKLVGTGGAPPRFPEHRVELDVRSCNPLRKCSGEGRFAGSRGPHDHDSLRDGSEMFYRNVSRAGKPSECSPSRHAPLSATGAGTSNHEREHRMRRMQRRAMLLALLRAAPDGAGDCRYRLRAPGEVKNRSKPPRRRRMYRLPPGTRRSTPRG